MAFVDIAGRTLHYVRLGEEHVTTPIVFLHEGLGSVELWRSFPGDVVEACRHPGLVYSRQGNGWSSPIYTTRESDYMHVEALEILPRLVERLVDAPPILLGHSDGASIALIHAGAGHPVAGMVLIAPHVFVEELTSQSIRSFREQYDGSDLEERMGRYHADPERTFLGWAEVWLSPEFRTWNIEEYLSPVTCPILLIQGDEDQYGTEAQLDALEEGVSGPVRRVMIPGAGHSPHLSHGQLVVDEVAAFVDGLP